MAVDHDAASALNLAAADIGAEGLGDALAAAAGWEEDEGDDAMMLGDVDHLPEAASVQEFLENPTELRPQEYFLKEFVEVSPRRVSC